MIYNYGKNEDKQLRRNFKLGEFHCHCKRSDCKVTKVDSELLDRLQWMRDKCGKSIHVNSGYRCRAHNSSAAVGGSKTSKHPMGQAADIVIAGMTPLDMARLAVNAGFRGIIRYNNRIHVDTRRTVSRYYRDKTASGYTPVKDSWGASIICNPWTLPEKAIKLGSKGMDVRWVQWALSHAGVACTVDGSCGPKTVMTIRKFQSDNNLKIDGICGPITIAKLQEVNA